MIKRISDIRGEMCTVLWDTGAQISLVTHQYAREAGFKVRPASIRLSGVGTGNKNKSRVQYRVLLRRWDGSLAEFTR
jgi:predicted aspartyl protease